MDVNLRSADGGEYLEVAVGPYPNPISYKGEYHYRSGSTRQVLRGAALNRFLLSKHGRNWDDAPLPGVGLKDLDRKALDEFRRLGVAADRLPRGVLEDSDDSLIDALRLREGEYLRRAAVLLFHPAPTRFFAGAFVKIGYFRTATDLVYQDVVEGDLLSQAERTVDLLQTKYSKAKVSYQGIYRRETPLVPAEALREAVLNAVVHRDYSISAPIQIRVSDDRVSLWNPGELPLGWTDEDLLQAHASAPYNPAIANAFFRAGTVEAWGRGIGDIPKTCRTAGTVEPSWRRESGGLRLDFVRSEAESEEAESQPESKAGQPESKAGQPESGATQPESQPESLKTRVLAELANGPLSKAKLSAKLGQKAISGRLNQIVRRLLAAKRIEYTIPEKPGSRLQKYRLTVRGRSDPGSSGAGSTEAGAARSGAAYPQHELKGTVSEAGDIVESAVPEDDRESTRR